MIKTHVFYHNDMDGLATLYAYYKLCHKRFNAVTVQYGDLSCFEAVEADSEVVFLDFCPGTTVMGRIQPYGSVLIVDHHSGAKEKVEVVSRWPMVNCLYDPDAHGACQLLYSAFAQTPPEFVTLIGDRDVRLLNDQRTQQLHEFFISLDIPIDAWGRWFDMFEWLHEPQNLAHACSVGAGLVKQKD
jgi:oligoribonuclease NrnB/cAMP/cGMP phosphodiesterase (DHH superfamily)